MQFEAGQYNNHLHSFSVMVQQWNNDLSQLEDVIDAKASKGESTAGLELNLAKGNDRYNKSLNTLEAAHRYIQAMQKEISVINHVKAENRELKKQIETIEKNARVRISDML